MPDGLRRATRALALSAALAGLVACAPMPLSSTGASAQVDRLAHLFTRTVPLDDLVSHVAQRNPQWPLNDYPDPYTPQQLACVRGELTAEKVTVTQREDARKFAQRHPERVAESIELLEGAADVMGQLMHHGAAQVETNKRPDATQVLSRFSAAQLNAFAELSEADQYRELRRALRIEGVIGPHSARQSFEAGRRLGRALLREPMLKALEHCQVPLGSLFRQPGGRAALGKRT